MRPSFNKAGNYLECLYAGTSSVPALRISVCIKVCTETEMFFLKRKYACEVSCPKREIKLHFNNTVDLKTLFRNSLNEERRIGKKPGYNNKSRAEICVSS